jgi:hypothetical protein
MTDTITATRPVHDGGATAIRPRTGERPRRVARGTRRWSGRTYKLLITTHVVVSVGWLGVVYGKLMLGIAAMTAGDPATALGLYAAMQVLNLAFPPVAVATILSGALLSLGTRWGLIRHVWVVVKIVLTFGVISTAVGLADRFVVRSLPAAPGTAATAPPTDLLLVVTAAHLLMLITAAVLSYFKPWGRIRWRGGASGEARSSATRKLRSGR